MKITVKPTAELLRRRGLESGGRVQQVIDSEVLRRSSPLTPYLGGDLERSGVCGTVIGSGEVVYNVPYGRTQYYGKTKSGKPFNYTTTKHARAGSYWFERMKAEHKEDILRLAKEEAGAI